MILSFSCSAGEDEGSGCLLYLGNYGLNVTRSLWLYFATECKHETLNCIPERHREKTALQKNKSLLKSKTSGDLTDTVCSSDRYLFPCCSALLTCTSARRGQVFNGGYLRKVLASRFSLKRRTSICSQPPWILLSLNLVVGLSWCSFMYSQSSQTPSS